MCLRGKRFDACVTCVPYPARLLTKATAGPTRRHIHGGDGWRDPPRRGGDVCVYIDGLCGNYNKRNALARALPGLSSLAAWSNRGNGVRAARPCCQHRPGRLHRLPTVNARAHGKLSATNVPMSHTPADPCRLVHATPRPSGSSASTHGHDGATHWLWTGVCCNESWAPRRIHHSRAGQSRLRYLSPCNALNKRRLHHLIRHRAASAAADPVRRDGASRARARYRADLPPGTSHPGQVSCRTRGFRSLCLRQLWRVNLRALNAVGI